MPTRVTEPTPEDQVSSAEPPIDAAAPEAPTPPEEPEPDPAARRREWLAGFGVALIIAVAITVSLRFKQPALPEYALAIEAKRPVAAAPDPAPAPPANEDEVQPPPPPELANGALPDDGTPAQVAGDTLLRLVARPASSPRVKLDARAFGHCGERDLTLNVPLTVDDNGEVRMEARVDALFGDTRGECELVIAIDRQGKLPATLEAANLASSARLVHQSLLIFP